MRLLFAFTIYTSLNLVDIINHAKFQLDRFGVSELQVAENRYLPLTGGIALTTMYALMLHCDYYLLIYLLTYLLTALVSVQMVMLECVTSKALTRETCEIIKVRLLSYRFLFHIVHTVYSISSDYLSLMTGLQLSHL